MGLAVVKALEALGAKDLKLKWPNDVLWKGRKLCGVLLEVVGDPTGECQVVIGIGINIHLSDEHLADIGQPAVDLHRVCGKVVSRNRVVSEVMNSLSHLLETFGEFGFAHFQKEWCDYDAFQGQEVQLVAATRAETGICQGVNEQGGLLLRSKNGTTVFHGGEVSLRKL